MCGVWILFRFFDIQIDNAELEIEASEVTIFSSHPQDLAQVAWKWLKTPVDVGWYWLTTVLNFGVLKRIQTPHSWFWDFWADKTFTTRQSGCMQSSSLSPSSSPCLLSCNHSQRLFQKTIESFDCKINGQALGAALLHSLGWLYGQAQTQGLYESAAVAAACLRKTCDAWQCGLLSGWHNVSCSCILQALWNISGCGKHSPSSISHNSLSCLTVAMPQSFRCVM